MATMDTEREIRDLKRRLDLAETKLAQHAGQFEFISGQLRDIQLYMHARFDDIDRRFDKIEGTLGEHTRTLGEHTQQFATLNAKVDALPRVIAELIGPR